MRVRTSQLTKLVKRQLSLHASKVVELLWYAKEDVTDDVDNVNSKFLHAALLIVHVVQQYAGLARKH